MICAASGLDLADCDKLLRVVALRACFIMPATLEHAVESRRRALSGRLLHWKSRAFSIDLRMKLATSCWCKPELLNTSKMNGNWDFLLHLHDIGRRRADDWLASNFDRIGLESSVNF